MALDLNEGQKDPLGRIVLGRKRNCGNNYADGIYDSTMFTEELERAEFLTMGFYFPVDSVIWSLGLQCSAAVNTNNNDVDNIAHIDLPGYQPVVVAPRNAEGLVRFGIQMFSPRDKMYGSVEAADTDGTTPYFPSTAAKRDNMGNSIDWALGSGAEEVPLHSSPGWLNKSGNMQYAYQTMTTAAGTRTVTVNFKRKNKKGKDRGFKVEAGTMAVFYIYNNTGGSNSDREIRLNVEGVPRVNFFPLKDIVQNLEYNNRSEARWGSNHQVELTTLNGHGVGRLFTRPVISQQEP